MTMLKHSSFFNQLLCVVIMVSLSTERVCTQLTQEKQALVAFLSSVPHENRIQWNESDSPCNWVGIVCDASRSFVSSLRLPGVGLVGQIPANTIGRLSNLRVLSLRSNRLSGEIPADFVNLTALRSLYLQNNLFSGDFPASFIMLNRLVRLDLSSNKFTGAIPFAVNNLTLLTGLLLENNQFSGNIPSINPSNLVDFNVSNNKLNGSIPNVLTKFSASSFAGNLDLCGGPLPPCNPFFPAPSPSSGKIPPLVPVGKKSKKLSKAAIIAIAVGSSLILFLILLVLFLCLCKKRKRQSPKPPKPVVTSRGAAAVHEIGTTSSSKEDITGTEKERNRLVFFQGGIYSFDLEDLLRASAEVLGKGSVGTTYKAVLEEGTTVVVKRLKDVVVSKREFDLQMEMVGKIKHENVVALRAYYFSKDEKLLVSDFMASGSLSSLLHGSRGSGRTPLDWDNRMKIATSVAKGLSHLHQSSVPHGNIKSSNVLLRPDHDVGISDYGLNPLFGTATPPNRVAGYRAPEVVETRKVTFKSDVYSYGVLLLELLTGKSPNQASLGDEGIDLPRWVQSVVREEWTAEVFDAELLRYHNIEEEMVQLLQIAMSCVAIVPEQRPTMPEVVRLIEDMNRSETDDGLRQSSDDPSKGSDGHTPPTDVRTSPRTATP